MLYTKYNHNKHPQILKSVGKWQAFCALRDEFLKDGDGTKAAKKDAENRALTKLGGIGQFEQLVPAVVKATPVRKIQELQKFLDAKPPASRADNIAWVHRAKGLLEIGGIVDFKTAPSWEAVSIFSTAKTDPNWAKKQAAGDEAREAEDDGGNLHILDQFLAATPEGPSEERPAEESDPPEGDGANA